VPSQESSDRSMTLILVPRLRMSGAELVYAIIAWTGIFTPLRLVTGPGRPHKLDSVTGMVAVLSRLQYGGSFLGRPYTQPAVRYC